MAEIVQKHSEHWVRELEDLRRTKLFTEDMIRHINVARKTLEARITSKHSANVDDYKDYITHETLVLKKIRKCRDQKRISEKKNSIDYSIINRIKRLYETALQRYPIEYSLHDGFYKFCKEHNFTSSASEALDNMIKFFSYQPEVWKTAANWFCHVGDIDKALQTIQKGVTTNPQSTLLYTTAIELELAQIVKSALKTDAKRALIESKCIENLKIYVTLIFKNIKNLDYIISVLDLLESHAITNPIQLTILEHMFENYKEEIIVWHTFAKRERKGLHFVTDSKEVSRSSCVESHVAYCAEKYEQGLKCVHEDRKKELWCCYLATLIEINDEIYLDSKLDKSALLRGAFQKAHAANCLDERHYSVWANIIQNNAERTKIFEQALEMYPTSEELWKHQLRAAIVEDKVIEVNRTFKRGVLALGNKALNLWLMFMRYHILTSECHDVKSIFEDGIEQPLEISSVLKPKYIDWIAFNEGMEAARKKYRELAAKRPYCLELHKTMIKLETGQLNVNYSYCEKIYERTCEQFGKEDVDVWTNYLKFIAVRKRDKYQEKIIKILDEAKKNLPPLLFEQFKENYDNILAEA